MCCWKRGASGFKATRSDRRCLFDPASVFADEVYEAIDGLGLGDVEFYGCLADIEVDLARGATDIAEVGVGHFAGAVYDAAHDGDFHAFEVAGGCFDSRGGCLEVEKGAAAAWAGDIVGFENADPSGLEGVVGYAERLARSSVALHEHGIADAVAEKRADIDGGI